MKRLILIGCCISQFILPLSANEDFYGEEDSDFEDYQYPLERISRKYEIETIFCRDETTKSHITCHEKIEQNFMGFNATPSFVDDHICLRCSDRQRGMIRSSTIERQIFIFEKTGINGCYEQKVYRKSFGCSICRNKIYNAFIKDSSIEIPV
ncbi:uncharacterized protein LOC135122876 [Zophobas morio]|uniref:uncharacterized protein LOC135122876 n=1 Tax=Zophobas morio TaxID=2755281 RepID=UPI0030837D69